MLRRSLLVAVTILLAIPAFTFAYVSPGKPTGYVSDFARLLKPETVASLNSELAGFTSQTGNEIAVAIIPTHGADETIESYAVQLFQEWGVGKKGQDNGVLLLISRDDREMRIEVGYGLEPIITDIESAHIISDVLTPAFQAGDYDGGVRSAVQRLESDIQNGGAPVESQPQTKHGIDFAGNIYLIFFVIIYLSSLLARSKSWWAGGIVGAILGFLIYSFIGAVILALVGLLLDYLVSKNYQKHKDNGTRPPWFLGGGGSGSGPGGSGFGGFGGGMSGGGGASGRW